MNVECPKCKKKYKVDEKLVPVGGAPVRCPACSNIFTIYRAPIDISLEPIAEETVSKPAEEMAVSKETTAPPQEKPPVTEPTVQTTETTTGEGIDTQVPPKEQRTKLWEKLQETYKSEKKSETVSAEETPPTTKEPPVTEEPTEISEEKPSETEITEEKVEETPSVTPPVQEPSEVETEETVQKEAVEEEPTTEEEKTEKEAKRLARSLVKDILLYHSDKVEIGLKQGNLAQLIGDEIRKSWKFYKDNFPLEKTGGVNYFKKALNEIIGKGKPIFK